MKWVIATGNRDKLREIEALFGDLPVDWLTLDDFPGVEMPEETGTTLEENALLKARAVHEATGLPAVADDTGLEVDALEGAPGVYSARFAGESASYEDNWRKLLDLLAQRPPEQRTARFRTSAVLVGSGDTMRAEGVVEGRITRKPRGTFGFGYDPVFEVTGTKKTFAEMTLAEKQSLSHRGRAFRVLHDAIMDNPATFIKREAPA